MKKLIYAICTLFFIYSCGVRTHTNNVNINLIGLFYNESGTYFFEFNQNNNFDLYEINQEKNLNKVSYGQWNINENGYLIIDNSFLGDNKLDTMDVKVNISKKSRLDSIYIKINNPIQNENNDNILIYNLELEFHEFYEFPDLKSLYFTRNQISIPNNIASVSIKNMYLRVRYNYPRNLYKGRFFGNIELETRTPIELPNNQGNFYEIDIPKLNYNYMENWRFNNEVLQIKDKNTIIWNNNEFKKLK